RIARGILADDAEAEDAAQEGWVLAFRHLHGFEGRSSFAAWLSRIVSRVALARARRHRLVLAGDVSEEIVDQRRGPERLASDRETRTSLEQAIDALPDGFRAVFVLREIEDMS